MEIERARRYKDKTNIMIKRTNQIDSWLQDISTDKFLEDDRTKLATYKAFQEIVEACMDIVAMMCKDMGIVPKDDTATSKISTELIRIRRPFLPRPMACETAWCTATIRPTTA